VLAYHADDDAKLILGHVKAAGFGMAECFATAPLVSVTLAEARRAWGHDVIIFGGVPSIILEEQVMGDAEFEAYMRDLFRVVAPGDALILGVSDNVMPRAQIERIERITQLVQEYGRYPLQA
jgi:archaellum biogenesis ATPase FlaH